MITYNYEYAFVLENEEKVTEWISNVIQSENKNIGEISYIFMTDEALLDLNKKHLNHDYYTDVISFDYTEDSVISGDIFISIDRVKENAIEFNTDFSKELFRVIIHGVLHFCGYKDKSIKEEALMRLKEEEKLHMFHMEHF